MKTCSTSSDFLPSVPRRDWPVLLYDSGLWGNGRHFLGPGICVLAIKYAVSRMVFSCSMTISGSLVWASSRVCAHHYFAYASCYHHTRMYSAICATKTCRYVWFWTDRLSGVHGRNSPWHRFHPDRTYRLAGIQYNPDSREYPVRTRELYDACQTPSEACFLLFFLPLMRFPRYVCIWA